jgi:hypothetical protein
VSSRSEEFYARQREERRRRLASQLEDFDAPHSPYKSRTGGTIRRVGLVALTVLVLALGLGIRNGIRAATAAPEYYPWTTEMSAECEGNPKARGCREAQRAWCKDRASAPKGWHTRATEACIHLRHHPR